MRKPATLHLDALDTYPPEMALWLEHFAAGRYRTSLDYIEAIWFPDRTDFYKGLIQLTVAMHQLATTNLITGPRYLFISCRKLLKAYEPSYAHVDVEAARRLAAAGLRQLRRRPTV